MYLRITRSSGDPSRMDEAMALNQEILAAVHRQPGFQSAYPGADRASGRAVAVSIWETQEQAAMPRDALGLGDLVSRLEAVGLQLEPPDVYEITGQV